MIFNKINTKIRENKSFESFPPLLRIRDSQFRTLKPTISEMRESIFKQISDSKFVTASLLKHDKNNFKKS